MKAMKRSVVAVSLLVISAMAPVVEAQQGVEKAAPGTLVAPAEALNSPLNMTESRTISPVKALPADKYGFLRHLGGWMPCLLRFLFRGEHMISDSEDLPEPDYSGLMRTFLVEA